MSAGGPGAAANHFSPSLMLAGMDYIAPSAECILPVTVRGQTRTGDGVGYRRGGVEDGAAAGGAGGGVLAGALKITLQDCLACSGCVTTAETILVNSQSREELLKAREAQRAASGHGPSPMLVTISDPTAASVAAYAGLSSVEEGHALIAGFVRAALQPADAADDAPFYVTDLRWANAISTAETAHEYARRVRDAPATLPLLVSACPGWVCYCEKQGSALLPHLSPVLSPQGIAGSYAKRCLAPGLYHLSLQPCFDRKLEAARDHFLPVNRANGDNNDDHSPVASEAPAEKPAPIYYTDCVLSTGELLEWMLEVDASLPWRGALDATPAPPSDAGVQRTSPSLPAPSALKEGCVAVEASANAEEAAAQFAATVEGSGGYIGAVVAHMQRATAASSVPGVAPPPLSLRYEQKRNHNHQLVTCAELPGQVFCIAYGFQQIQNTVRAIKKKLPAARAYTLVELMACPDGCLNGGGQIRAADPTAADATLRRVKAVFARGLVPNSERAPQVEEAGAPPTRQLRLQDTHTVVSSRPVQGLADSPFSADRLQQAVATLGDALWRCTFTDRQKEFEKMLDEGNIHSLKW